MLGRKLLSIIFLILLASTVNSIGIAPSLQLIDFKPSAEQKITFYIFNNENTDFNARIEITGELSDYVSLEKDTIYIPADAELTPFEITLNTPETIERPGPHSINIVVSKQPISSKDKGQTSILTTESIVGELRIMVPYPGKYIEAAIAVDSTEETATFVISLVNYGKEPVDVYGTLDIHDENKLATIQTSTTYLEAGSRGKLEATWSNQKGNYNVVANINYADKTIELKKNFDIGGPSIDIVKILISDFKSGEIADIDISLENQWNKEDEFYCEAALIDKDGQELIKEKTASKLIKPYSEDTLNAYLDTKDLPVGNYTLKINAYSQKTAAEATTLFKIPEEEKIIEKIGINLTTILLALLIVAIIITAILVVRKKKRMID